MAINLTFDTVHTNGLVDFMQKFPLPSKESCLETDSTKQSSCRRALFEFTKLLPKQPVGGKADYQIN